MARQNSNSRTKRPTKWVSSAVNGAVPDADSLAVADAVVMTNPTTEIFNQPDPTIVSVRGQLFISRALVTSSRIACAWAIVMMRLDVGGVVPTQVFDPFGTADLERQDVLGMGHLDIPPIAILPSNDSSVIQRGVLTREIHIKVSRKLAQNTNNLFFWIASTDSSPPGVDDELHVIGSFRTLLKFA